MKNEAILVVGHGSKSAHAQSDFEKIVALVDEKLPETVVRGAHMELAKPSIEETVNELWNAGIRSFKIVPYFLYNGMHIKKDIPEILENLKKEYSGLQYVMGDPIGVEPLMADILIKKAGEISVD